MCGLFFSLLGFSVSMVHRGFHDVHKLSVCVVVRGSGGQCLAVWWFQGGFRLRHSLSFFHSCSQVVSG